MMTASAGMAAVKSKAPEKTVISAENFTFNPLKNIAVYQGDVVVIDAQMDLLCDKLTIHFADKDKAPKKPVVPPPNKSGAGTKPIDCLLYTSDAADE